MMATTGYAASVTHHSLYPVVLSREPARHRSLSERTACQALSDRVPRRSTLAEANESRDWRIYAELAQRLVLQARKVHANEDLGMDLNAVAYALDSTTIYCQLKICLLSAFHRRVEVCESESPLIGTGHRDTEVL
jgi:hypothetical protein